ncbi:MAG: hypothetical protein LBV04_10555 [Deferribacteraceae bacterium]|nr:hypothetical protein [Deferribacteraceae bacterium]
MNTFYYDKGYRLLLALLFLLCLAAIALGYYSDKGTVPMKLAAAFSLAVIVYLVPACISRVRVDGDMIYTRSLMGSRSLRLPDVDSISVIKLKGRYVILLLTEAQYVSISTHYWDFMQLKDLLREHIPTAAFEKLEQISELDVQAANKRLKLTVAAVCLLFTAVILYFNFIRQ